MSNPGLSDSKAVTITVDNNFRDPATLKFAHVKNVLQNGSTCTTCHLQRPSPQPAATPPIWFTDFDRNFSGGAADATDDAWFYSELMGRVNFTEIGDSPLLRKPTGNHHNGSTLFDLTLPAGLSNYSIIYNWILNGAPPGGVAATAGADSTNNVAFTGSPASATISLNGNSSIGATSFAWTMVSFTPTAHPNGTSPTGSAPSISSPNSASATLNVFDIGTYVVRLTVSNGADMDFADRTITVTETAVNAAASPSGTVAVSFSGAPLSGTISLDSSGSTGNPLAFAWSYSPSGLSGACGTISNATLAMATLTVPSSAVGNSCTFLLTTSNLSTTDQATTVITIASAGSGIVANAGASGSVTRTFTNPSVTLGVPDSTGIPVAPTIALSGSASTGPGTLTYSWSVIAAPGNATGSYAPSIASPSSVNTTLTVHRRGLYTVRLFVDNGLPSGPSNTADRDITVNVTSGNTFTDMKSTFVSRGCTGAGCHVSGSTVPPSWVDETVGVLTLYQRVTARVNGTDPANSSIVVCPSGGACGMGKQPGFHDADVSSYTQFLNWIIDGAQNN